MRLKDNYGELLKNIFNPIFVLLIFIVVTTLLYFLSDMLSYDFYKIICEFFVVILLLIVYYEFNKKNKAIRLLNEALSEKEKLTKKLEKTNIELQNIATKDSLTGIGNRRYYFEFGDKAFYLAKRENKLLSLITIDIDNFKNINDKFGHQVGDDVLKLVASSMESEIRKSDILARVGGEEFSIVLPNTNLDEAMIISEKIRTKIKATSFCTEDIEISVTGSLGVSQIEKDDTDLDDIYARADKALYKAKSSGKNRVCYS